jgi:hypothetical protein
MACCPNPRSGLYGRADHRMVTEAHLINRFPRFQQSIRKHQIRFERINTIDGLSSPARSLFPDP